jgi:hypothetical protein
MSRRAFLLTWNPKETPWPELDRQIRKLEDADTHEIDGRWSCGRRRHLPINSRVFLMRLGQAPKGIIASGQTLCEPYRRTHWRIPGKYARYVNIRFDMLAKRPIIPLQTLLRPPFAGFPWTPESSGSRFGHPLQLSWKPYGRSDNR